LLPFTFTRPVAGVRCGILTLAGKWERRGHRVGYLTQPYLRGKFGAGEGTLYVNGAVCADDATEAALHTLVPGGALRLADETLLAFRAEAPVSSVEELLYAAQEANALTHAAGASVIRQPWHLFKQNGAQLRADFSLVTRGRQSAAVADRHTIVYGEENLFLEEGVKIRAAILNAENGPIYLGRGVQVQEGSVIVGPCAIGEDSVVNVGAKLRGDNTVGPHCKVGGEVSNTIFFGYSNKGHDGFIGNSVVGEWCNLGADTNTSNLKNNYAPVKLWSYAKGGFVNTGEQFCGLMMGDHAKAGINTMFNTGTVVGVGANVFGAGYPRNFIPAFAWGGAQGFDTFKLGQMLEVAERVMERRKVALDEVE
ncbi:MAG TPA: putative sugar nucleotidyl transferase, partial [bacterium]|nr:putative sugar nucleotidyl transferase [bacterium]